MSRRLIGDRPMTDAERKARSRARLREGGELVELPPTPKPVRPLPRPKRWERAVVELVALQEEYQAWRDGLPESLHGTALGEKLQAIADLDLAELESIIPPKGYGRD